MNIVDGRTAIGPDFAKEIISKCSIPEQAARNKNSEPRIALKAAAMEVGIWRPNSQITFARCDGKVRLVDGYGRLYAVIKTGKTLVFDVSVINVSSDQEVATLWATFDERVLNVARSRPQSLRALNVSEDLGIHPLVADAVLRAMPTIANNMRLPNYVGRIAPEMRLQAVQGKMAMDWVTEARAYNAACKGMLTHLRSSMLTIPATAVALQTFRHQPGLAEPFWRAVAKDTGRPDTPEATLSMALHRKRLQTESGAGLLIVAAAWNAFFTQRPLSKIVVPSSGLLSIAGTPIKDVQQFTAVQEGLREARRLVSANRRARAMNQIPEML